MTASDVAAVTLLDRDGRGQRSFATDWRDFFGLSGRVA